MISEQLVLVVNVMDAAEIGRSKDLRDFGKNQSVMAGCLGQSISERPSLVGCSWSAMIRTYGQWTEE